jgi:hypothetical protein
MHPYSLRASQKYQEHGMKLDGLGDLTVTKQNKLLGFIDI